MRQDIGRPHMRLEANLAWRLHFRETLALIRQLLAEYSPEDMRHAELLALCQLDSWDRSPNKLTIADFLKDTLKKFFWRYLNAGIKPTATCIAEHSGFASPASAR